MDRVLGLRLELDVVDPAALDAHQMVMVVLERLGQLVPGHTVAAVMQCRHLGVRQDAESAVDGGQRHGALEIIVNLGGRYRAARSRQCVGYEAPALGEPHIGCPQPGPDLIEELRDPDSPSTLITAY